MAEIDRKSLVVPVEKMARRILQRHNLYPPYSLEDLVKQYATVEFYRFPFEADGITIGIGGEALPQILINNSTPEVRQKFTLAHELGHVIIPWHTGTIVSHIDEFGVDFEYREMEAEANKFAAELLIPSSWLNEVEHKFETVYEYISEVMDCCGVSRDAAMIKIFNCSSRSIICAEVNIHGGAIKKYRTKVAPQYIKLERQNLLVADVFDASVPKEIFELGDRRYVSWEFKTSSVEETDQRPWREVLSQILDETSSQSKQQSLNAIVPNQYQKFLRHDASRKTEEICSLIIQEIKSRNNLEAIANHELFPQYILKRIKELASK